MPQLRSIINIWLIKWTIIKQLIMIIYSLTSHMPHMTKFKVSMDRIKNNTIERPPQTYVQQNAGITFKDRTWTKDTERQKYPVHTYRGVLFILHQRKMLRRFGNKNRDHVVRRQRLYHWTMLHNTLLLSMLLISRSKDLWKILMLDW